MIEWFLGLVAEGAYYVARFHERRADRDHRRATYYLGRARGKNAKADKWARIQHWADRVDGPFDAEAARP